MEIKKTPKADLTNKKLLFREIGLVLVLGVVLLAFEWSTKEKAVSSLGQETKVEVEEEMIPVTNEQPEHLTFRCHRYR